MAGTQGAPPRHSHAGPESVPTGERLAAARRATISKLLGQHHSLEVAALARHLDVSETTIRRDLERLQADGVLRRTHGGAVIAASDLVFRMPSEIPNADAKRRIARLAATLIDDDDTIALDAGTTTAALAAEIRNDRRVTVVTNDLHIAYELTGYPNVSLNVTGGSLNGRFYELLGPLALDAIRRVRTSKAILGCSALSPTAGITDDSLDAAEIKRAMIESSETLVVIADSSKLGRTLLGSVAPVDSIGVLVTDHEASPSTVEALRDRGVLVYLA